MCGLFDCAHVSVCVCVRCLCVVVVAADAAASLLYGNYGLANYVQAQHSSQSKKDSSTVKVNFFLLLLLCRYYKI